MYNVKFSVEKDQHLSCVVMGRETTIYILGQALSHVRVQVFKSERELLF